MSEQDPGPPPEPTWESDPPIAGARYSNGYAFWSDGDLAFHVHRSDPRVRVVDDSDGHVRGLVQNGELVRLWLPQQVIDAD